MNSILGERSGNDGHYIPDMTIRPDWIKEYTENIFVSALETSLDVNAKKMPQVETEFLNTAMKELGMVNYWLEKKTSQQEREMKKQQSRYF